MTSIDTPDEQQAASQDREAQRWKVIEKRKQRAKEALASRKSRRASTPVDLTGTKVKDRYSLPSNKVTVLPGPLPNKQHADPNPNSWQPCNSLLLPPTDCSSTEGQAPELPRTRHRMATRPVSLAARYGSQRQPFPKSTPNLEIEIDSRQAPTSE